jgi:hypothetical protein
MIVSLIADLMLYHLNSHRYLRPSPRALLTGLLIGYKKSLAPHPVTARKDDAPATYQAAITNLAGLASFSGGGGLIQTTSG